MGKRSKYEVVVSLMCSSGILLVISGAPAMILVMFSEFVMGRIELTEATMFASVMAVLTFVTGCILYSVGSYLAKRGRSSKIAEVSS